MTWGIKAIYVNKNKYTIEQAREIGKDLLNRDYVEIIELENSYKIKGYPKKLFYQLSFITKHINKDIYMVMGIFAKRNLTI